MSALVYRLLLLSSVIAAFFWLQVPELHRYSGQVFALVVVIYFVLKRLSNAKIWHLAPNVLSVELPLVTFAVLILIGATGNLHSIYYPVSYIHLFFLVFATDVGTSILILLAIILFHYGLAPAFTSQEISFLSSLPVITLFFMFAKAQYTQAQTNQKIVQNQEQELLSAQTAEVSLQTFLVTTLQPKLEQMQQLLQYPEQNRTTLKSQLTWLQLQIEKLNGRPPTS
jgi:hypothetical protein